MPVTAEKTRLKVRAHRERMRRKGMRLVQLWLPDTRSSTFRREARRASLAVARSAQAHDDQAFVDATAAWDWDE